MSRKKHQKTQARHKAPKPQLATLKMPASPSRAPAERGPTDPRAEALREAIDRGFGRMVEGSATDAFYGEAWDLLMGIIDADPSVDLAALSEAMRADPLPVFVEDYIGWLIIECRRQEGLIPRLREVSEAALKRLAPAFACLHEVARSAAIRSLDWSGERAWAEREIARWLRESPQCAQAWMSWCALHFETGCVVRPEDDLGRARAILEQGLRHVTELNGRETLLCELGNLLLHLGHKGQARLAHEEAMAIHRNICFGNPLPATQFA